MMLSRRRFTRGGAALAAAAILRGRSAHAQGTLQVRRSIGDLIRENSPMIDSLRRGVDVMMQRPMTDKTSWLFQAAIHDIADEEITDPLKPLAHYWQQCPHRNYFFLNWHRMYLYYFERILRKASGDPDLALPYWRYEDPQQASLPAAFAPDGDELTANPPVPPARRRNPLARAIRLAYIDSRLLGLGDVSRDVADTMKLDRFSTDDVLDAQNTFGGIATTNPLDEIAAGGIEAAPHNLVHKSIGLAGDMGSPQTAARDPIFWLHHANIDRLWAKWTDPARGRISPLDDEVWMTKKFKFVDENGEDQEKSGAEVLDTQFQLGYRYDDDPPREKELDLRPPLVALAPGAGPAGGLRSKGFMRARPTEPTVLARANGQRLTDRESRLAFAAVGRAGTLRADSAARLRVVLRDVVARDGAPPYDVFLVADRQSTAPRARLGSLAEFGGAGAVAHAHRGGGHGGADHAVSGGATIAFEATRAIRDLARSGINLRRLAVAIVRRGFPQASGGEFVPPDPDPPRIGAVELLQS